MAVQWDEKVDVIIIGAGFAGLSAAIEASLSGASVLVLEKMKGPGGNSIISDGGVAAAGTSEQHHMGIEDSPELMFSDMMKAGLGINDSELVRTLTEQSKDAYEWSKNFLGVKYLDRIDIFGGHSVPRCYTAEKITGVTIIKRLMKKIDELSIAIRFSCFFEDFIINKDHRIDGVIVGEDYRFRSDRTLVLKNLKADKAVILAAGGFASDVDFRSQHDSRLTSVIKSTTQPFSTAEALKAGIDAGAATVDLSHIQLGPWASPDESGYGYGPSFSEYIVFPNGVIIDPLTGKRFSNELGDRKSLSDSILETGHPCIGIADSTAVIESGWSIAKCLAKGVVRSFESINALAQFYRMDKVELKKTINRFNGFVSSKCDSDFHKPVLETAKEIATPPFYGVRLWPKVHHTMGGLKINREAQVLDSYGSIIPGLYAAGEVTGGVHGASRLGSCAITECFVFGRIAGKNAVLK